MVLRCMLVLALMTREKLGMAVLLPDLRFTYSLCIPWLSLLSSLAVMLTLTSDVVKLTGLGSILALGRLPLLPKLINCSVSCLTSAFLVLRLSSFVWLISDPPPSVLIRFSSRGSDLTRVPIYSLGMSEAFKLFCTIELRMLDRFFGRLACLVIDLDILA